MLSWQSRCPSYRGCVLSAAAKGSIPPCGPLRHVIPFLSLSLSHILSSPSAVLQNMVVQYAGLPQGVHFVDNKGSFSGVYALTPQTAKL